MENQSLDTTVMERRFRESVKNRRFEIDLFWKRSLFFLGFIAASIVAFAEFTRIGSRYAVVAAAFGFLSSLAWAFANRGSKFWQEYWESRIKELEADMVGPGLFDPNDNVMPKKDWWFLSAERYSVTKLTIALSYFMATIWLGIVVYEAIKTYTLQLATYARWLGIPVAILSLLFALIIWFGTRGKSANQGS